MLMADSVEKEHKLELLWKEKADIHVPISFIVKGKDFNRRKTAFRN